MKKKNEDQELPKTLLSLLRKERRNEQKCLLGVESPNESSL